MANEKDKKKVKLPTAKKRDIQNAKKRITNRVFKSRVKTALRSFSDNLKAEKTNELSDSLNLIYSLMDKGVKKGIFKQNKAARVKARFSNYYNKTKA